MVLMGCMEDMVLVRGILKDECYLSFSGEGNMCVIYMV